MEEKTEGLKYRLPSSVRGYKREGKPAAKKAEARAEVEKKKE